MSQYIFGDIDIPKLDEDTSPIPPFDLTRSMRLNPENILVQAIYSFVGHKVDLVRRDLAEKNKKRKESEEAKKLEKQASIIASLINADFNEFRQKLAKVKAKAPGSTDLRDILKEGDSEDVLIEGVGLPAEIIIDTGETGHGAGKGGRGEDLPDHGERLRPVDGGVFWLKSELFLMKILTANFDARHPAKKFSSHFLICAPPIFSSPPVPRLRRAGKRKRKLFCWVLL